MRDLSDLTVAVVSGVKGYPQLAPFDPPEHYPESPYPSSLDPANGVYPMVREAMHLLELDNGRFGTPDWNPLSELVSPGNRVLIKPNFVLHRNHGCGPVEAVITHASILRTIADYVLIALRGSGELIIGDAPQMNCEWASLLRVNGLAHLADHLNQVCSNQGVRFRLSDFRREETKYRYGVVWERKTLPSCEERTVRVCLGSQSVMDGVDVAKLYGADYCRTQTIRAHQSHRHEYCIAREVLDADVVISVPKLKVHSKVGATLNFKNMVGINTNKNHLAHFRVGSQRQGGDEFSDPQWDDILERRLSDALLGTFWRVGKYPFVLWRALRLGFRAMFPRGVPTLRCGDWSGNDTAWRMTLDLSRILLTADGAGAIHSSPQRKYFSFIDGIVGGQGDGPLKPDAYLSGALLAGANPLAVDWTAARLMGLSPEALPLYSHAPDQMREWVSDFDPSHIGVRSNSAEWENLLTGSQSVFDFERPPGWR